MELVKHLGFEVAGDLEIREEHKILLGSGLRAPG